MKARLLAGLLLVAGPTLSAAQTAITLRADSTRRVIAPGSKLAVPVILDMSAAAGTNLGSLTTGVTFGKASLNFDSVKAGGFGSLTPNTSGVANGSLTLGVFDANGTTTTQTLATMYFTASSTTGWSTISFSPTVAGSGAGANILSLMHTRPLDVCVLPGGKWGDVNGDSVATPLGDGNVNVIDAQQIARYTVGLAVANRSGIVARGDVNNDNAVNIIDAQQIARFTVGLSAATRVGTFTFSSLPTASISLQPQTAQSVDVGGGTLQLTASARDVNNVDVGYCATMTWTSSDPSIATVSANGLVQGIAVGTATITATSNGQSSSVAVTALPFRFTALTAGHAFTCGLTSSSAVYCWGIRNVGQLGDSTLSGGTLHDGRLRPVAVKGGIAFAGVTAGELNACGWTSLGAAYCWGLGDFGQVGNGQTPIPGVPFPPFVVPDRVIGGLNLTTLEPGYNKQTCALTATGAAYCWGYNFDGQLGDGTTTDRSTPTAVVGGRTFTALTATRHVCGLTGAGAVYCWGYNGFGELGDGTTTSRSSPVAVQQGGLVFTALSAGIQATCGLTNAGAAYCWGQIFYGAGAGQATPAAVPGGLVFTTLTVGGGHACALTSVGAAYCWGNNGNGELGDGSTNSSASPVLVQGAIVFTALTAGDSHTCGLTTTGAAYCWGYNFNGGLGDGSVTNRPTPVAVLPP